MLQKNNKVTYKKYQNIFQSLMNVILMLQV